MKRILLCKTSYIIIFIILMFFKNNIVVAENNVEVFTKIYDANKWQVGSGPGSVPDAIHEFVANLFKR